jgi:hypothetical protein
MGTGVEEDFLKRLAKDHSGFSSLITQDDSISLVMENFLRKISYPLIRNISINYGGLDKYDVFPRPMPNLYAGTQLTQMGRYRNTGTFNVTFKGHQGSDSMALTQELSFPANVPNHPFVPRMWASGKIDYLLDEIAIYGEQTELVDAVKYLGKRYQIITPYTSMLVIEPTDIRLIEDKTAKLAKQVNIINAPNPFRTSTLIKISVPKLTTPQRMTIRIYDIQGKLIRTLVTEITVGGNFMIRWDRTNQIGYKVAAGYYLAVLEIGNMRKMIKMQVIK